MVDHFTNGKSVFRVYDKKNKRKFIDYEIAADEFEVVIKDKFVAFKKYRKQDYLDWNDEVLGKNISKVRKPNEHAAVVNKVIDHWKPYCKITKKVLRKKK